MGLLHLAQVRYFVYKDSQILGPFEREELDRAGGLRPETLVCPEGASGRRDADWRTLEEIADLAGVATLPPPLTGFDGAPLGGESALLERLELESLGVPLDEDREPDWLKGIFDDAEFKQRWGLVLPEGDVQSPDGKVRELTSQLDSLKKRIAELEAEQARLLAGGRPAAPAAPTAPASAAAPAPAAEPVLKVKTREMPRPADADEPLPLATPAPAPAAGPAPLPLDAFAPPTELPPAPPPVEEAPAVAPPPQPGKFALKRAEEPSGLKIKFGATKTFKTAAKPDAAAPGLPPAPASAPAPAALPATPAYEWGQQAPTGALPTAPAAGAVFPPLGTATPPPTTVQQPPAMPALAPAPMPALTPAPAAAPTLGAFAPAPEPAVPTLQPPAPAPAPTPAPLPPMTMRFGAPTQAPATGGVPPLEAPPIPTNLGGPSTNVPTPAATPFPTSPMTMISGSGSAAAAAAIQPQPVPAPPQTQDVLARLAKPAPAPDTAAPKPPRSNKKLFMVLGGLVAVLGIVMFVFLRNTRDLKTMASMGTDQKPIGIEPDQAAGGGNGAFAPRPQAQQQAQAPAQPQAAPAAPPAQEPPPAPVADLGQKAMELVKEYPLDGDRGTVAQWLQFQFTANPEAGNKEEWTAGAVGASTYMVQYRVLPGPGSAVKDVISYLFEADVERQTVRGQNPAARQLMAGQPQAAKPKAKAKAPAKKPAAKKKPKAVAAPREVPLAPLPTDAELLPPADNDSQFRNDTVNPPL